MNTDQITGTPPTLWNKRGYVQMSADLVRASEKARQVALCAQIEKLSWMLERIDAWCTNKRHYAHFSAIKDAEDAWLAR